MNSLKIPAHLSLSRLSDMEKPYLRISKSCGSELPGTCQEMEKHAHEVQCRFYVVLEGSGHVWVGDGHKKTEKGTVTWIPSGHPHRIVNSGIERMVLLVGIVPPQADKMKNIHGARGCRSQPKLARLAG